jgi:predicted enzyme related to lactoylglutathione lyase
MACRMTELIIDARDPSLLAAFWSEVLGYVETDRDDSGIEISPPTPGTGAPAMVFLRNSDARRGKLPMHLDVNATDRDQDAELQRLLELGAVPADIGQGEDVSWHVLADPEGNEFCLLRTRVEPIGT